MICCLSLLGSISYLRWNLHGNRQEQAHVFSLYRYGMCIYNILRDMVQIEDKREAASKRFCAYRFPRDQRDPSLIPLHKDTDSLTCTRHQRGSPNTAIRTTETEVPISSFTMDY